MKCIPYSVTHSQTTSVSLKQKGWTFLTSHVFNKKHIKQAEMFTNIRIWSGIYMNHVNFTYFGLNIPPLGRVTDRSLFINHILVSLLRVAKPQEI